VVDVHFNFCDFLLLHSNRNKCTACQIIATDIDAVHKTIHPSTSLRDVLEDETFCGGTGARHAPPYGWLETVCEEMVEDKIG
jgi:hypothetical protein